MGDAKPVTPKASPSMLLGSNFFKRLSGKFSKQNSDKSSMTPSSSSEQSTEPTIEPTQSVYLPQPCAEVVQPQPQSHLGIFNPSSSYVHCFSDEDYSYPCDKSGPPSPVSTTHLPGSCSEEKVKEVLPIFVPPLSGLEDKALSSSPREVRFAQGTN